jgi:hypothetical protein
MDCCHQIESLQCACSHNSGAHTAIYDCYQLVGEQILDSEWQVHSCQLKVNAGVYHWANFFWRLLVRIVEHLFNVSNAYMISSRTTKIQSLHTFSLLKNYASNIPPEGAPFVFLLSPSSCIHIGKLLTFLEPFREREQTTYIDNARISKAERERSWCIEWMPTPNNQLRLHLNRQILCPCSY